MFIPLITY